MKFLVDAQLSPALAYWLREAGYEAAHVVDLGLRDAEDGEIWVHALESGAEIMRTKILRPARYRPAGLRWSFGSE